MDAKKLFGMIKPHLDQLDNTQKILLSKLITSPGPERITCHHRKVRPISKAKEYLETFREKEVERERRGSMGL